MTRSSTSRLRAAALALGLCAINVAAGCVHCDDTECDGGFEWRASPAAGVVAPGLYTFEADLDGMWVGIDCTVGETMDASSCSEASAAEFGLGEWEVAMELVPAEDGSVAAFSLSAVELVDENHSWIEMKGPKSVSIAMLLDDDILVESTYELEYETDETYRGHEACGSCELGQSRTATWP
jgi:hypothetical protein